MAKMKPAPVPDPGSFNMTPMIDIVFQLIIFFMLIMDMSKRETTPLNLPEASKALEDSKPDESLLVINIMGDDPRHKNGDILVYGVSVDNHPIDDNTLIAIFRKRREQPEYLEPGGVKGKGWAKYGMLIRADISTQWRHVQKVLTMAPIAGGVTRAELGAKKPAQ